jgi:uncharacterized membrane protein
VISVTGVRGEQKTESLRKVQDSKCSLNSAAKQTPSPAPALTLTLSFEFSWIRLIGSFIIALLATIVLEIRPFLHGRYQRIERMLESMQGQSTTSRLVSWTLTFLFLVVLIYLSLQHIRRSTARDRWWAVACAALLSWTLTIPGSNSDGHTWYAAPDRAWFSVRLRVFYFIRWVVLGLVLFLALSCVFAGLERTASRSIVTRSPMLSRLGLRWGSVSALAGIIFLCWIPIFIIDGPVHIFIDTTEQITMYRVRTTQEWMNYLRPAGSWLNDQHPFVDTLLYGVTDDIGRAMGNEVLAFALLTWIQGIVCAFALALTVCWIRSRTRASDWLIWSILFVICFVPVFPMNMAVVMKDATWMPIFIFWLVAFSELVWRILGTQKHADIPPVSARLIVLLCVLSVLAGLTKKTSAYITMLSTLSILVIMAGRGRWNGKQAGQVVCAALTAPILVLALIPATLFGPLNISSGNPAEFLAVPMQQVTKAFIDHGRDISDSDRKIVNSVMDLRHAEAAFRPSSSNTGVKNSYRWFADVQSHRGSTKQSRSVAHVEATRQQTLEFLALWVRLGVRYPHSYVTAVPYLWDAFVPGRIISRGFGPMRSGKHAQHIFMENIKTGSYSWTQRVLGRPVMTVLATVPPFCILADISLYTVWIPLMAAMSCILRRRYRQLVLLVPTLLLLLIQMVVQVAEVRLSLGFLCVFPIALAASNCGVFTHVPVKSLRSSE